MARRDARPLAVADRRSARCVEILLVIVWIPYNYFGGGGVLGNRYFMSTYGLLLFLLPPLESIGAALVPWASAALFTAQIVLNPFYSSFNPAEHAKSGPLRWLPVEMTLLNDLPITTRPERVRVCSAREPRVLRSTSSTTTRTRREGDGSGCAAIRAPI